MKTFWVNSPSATLLIAKQLRAQLLAIAVDAENQKLPATTSSTTGVAGRIYEIVKELDERTDNKLAS